MKRKWRVYISSTFVDLKEYRAALINIFQKQLKDSFELTDIMERMFDKGNYRPFVRDCVAAVKASDIYIIIQGNKTGSYPPDDPARTYTEIEFDTAEAEGKKIFLLRLAAFDPAQVDNPDKLDSLLQKFEGRDLHTFSNQEELELRLYECLSQYAAAAPVVMENPYKGLAAFDTTDGLYFHGRNQETDKCLQLIFSRKPHQFISVIGNSGVGKTSFVQAGILYKLKIGANWGFSEHVQVIFNPANQPYSNLLFALRKNGLTLESLGLSGAAGTKFILFINQFEEVITQCTDEAAITERENLFKLLDQLTAADNNGRFFIITSFRSDVISELANFDFIKMNQVFFPLNGLDYKVRTASWEAAVTDIICKPALTNGVTIEPQLVTQLLKEIKEVDGSLPILEFTLQKLWNPATIEDGTISAAEYISLSGEKGLAGIIEKHAEEVVKRITQEGELVENERILKSIFVNLVEVTSNLLDVKKTVNKSELLNKLTMYPADKVNEVLEQLIREDGRLLLVSGEAQHAKVDIIHEVLIRKWDRLAGWINERRQALVTLETVMNTIAEWKNNNQDPELLYPPSRLKVLQKWEQENLDISNDDIRRFINQSVIKDDLLFEVKLSQDADLWEKSQRKSTYLYRPAAYNALKKWIKRVQSTGNPSIHAFVTASRKRNRNSRFAILSLPVIAFLIGFAIWNYNKTQAHKTLCFDSPFIQELKKKNPGLDPEQITALTLDNETNVRHLECFDKLAYLSIATSVPEFVLSGLKNLSHLKSLELRVTGSFYQFQNLGEIDSLRIVADSVDLVGVGTAKNLHFLKIESSKITGLSELKTLPNLNCLALKLKDGANLFSALADCPVLATVTIDADSLDVKDVEKLRFLRSLTVFAGKISNVSELGDAKSMRSLSLNGFYLPETLIRLPDYLDTLTIIPANSAFSLAQTELPQTLIFLNIGASSSLLDAKGIENLKKLKYLNFSAIKTDSAVLGKLNASDLSQLDVYGAPDLKFIQSFKSLNSITISYPATRAKECTILSPLLTKVELSRFDSLATVRIVQPRSSISMLKLFSFKGQIIFPDISKIDFDTILVSDDSRGEKSNLHLGLNFREAHSVKNLIADYFFGYDVPGNFANIESLRIRSIGFPAGIVQTNGVSISEQVQKLFIEELGKLKNLKKLYIDFAIAAAEINQIQTALGAKCQVIPRNIEPAG